MKTKREIIESISPHEVNDGSLPRYYPAEVEVFMDEYVEEFAKEFAFYLIEERWKVDHQYQKTHTISEHMEYFKNNVLKTLPSAPEKPTG